MWCSIHRRLPKRTLFLASLVFISLLAHLFVLMILALIFGFKMRQVHHLIVHNRSGQKTRFVFRPTPRHQMNEAKTVTQKSASKKTLAKPVVQKPSVAQKKEVPCEKKVSVTKLKEKPKKTVDQKKVKEKEKKRKEIKKDTLDKTAAVDRQKKEEISSVIEIGAAELAHARLQEQVYAAVNTHWHSPIAIRACECEIAFCIDTKGVPYNVSIVRSSQILIYDMAARNAIYQASFPATAQNKEFCIVFRS